ncbi:hypothetical protein LSUB1_G001436 [Lachnellula subtilissima]|uniref:Uncharacterized protein n=1 Tax=Lachnellula subtilissima TaxID=602034 RepID=A0A8H8UGP2_9HELO|nr:hypothetical protein LSUB1_G001436 [Lachnellula subtilissima]
MDPTQKSPERAFALQKYLLLHSQHDALQKHLSQIITSLPELSSSPESSPDRYRQGSISSSAGSDSSYLSSSPPKHARHHHRSGSIPFPQPQRPVLKTRRSSLPTVVTESLLGEIEEDETRLKDVNQQIKSTLTALLNCESVRGDRRYRNWVQTRLMDAELELKKSRCRSCNRRKSEDPNGMTL